MRPQDVVSTEMQILLEIEEFIIRSGMPATKFGRQCFRAASFVDRLRKGGGVTARSIDKARAFMAARRTWVSRYAAS